VSEHKIEERLLGLVRVEDMSGLGLANILQQKMEAHGLNFENIVGQCYDGANNMSGQYNGLQAHIKAVAGEKAIYTHCYTHVLALVLEQSASSCMYVTEVFTLLNNLYKFLKHYKVLVLYESILQQFEFKGKSKLQSLSETRWYARSTNLDIALNAHAILIALFKKIIPDKEFSADLRMEAT
jgi:hypothetical protein